MNTYGDTTWAELNWIDRQAWIEALAIPFDPMPTLIAHGFLCRSATFQINPTILVMHGGPWKDELQESRAHIQAYPCVLMAYKAHTAQAEADAEAELTARHWITCRGRPYPAGIQGQSRFIPSLWISLRRLIFQY